MCVGGNTPAYDVKVTNMCLSMKNNIPASTRTDKQIAVG